MCRLVFSLIVLWLLVTACQTTQQTLPTPTVHPIVATSIPVIIPSPQAVTPTVTLRPGLPTGTVIPVPMPRPVTPATPTFSPTVYLEEALAYIQLSALTRDRVDWAGLKQEALALAKDARTTADTYPSIRLILQRLGDRQATLLAPDEVQAETGQTRGLGLLAVYPERTVALVLSGSPADKAGVKVGDVIETVKGMVAGTLAETDFQRALKTAPLHLNLKRGEQMVEATLQAADFDPNRPPVVKRIGQVGYLDLPDLVTGGPMFVMYPNLTQAGIRETDQAGVCGWILDLRRTTGGNQWPLLAGIGPLLGEGEVGAFVGPGRKIVWTYRNGQAQSGIQNVVGVQTPYRLQQADPPVAVLTSRLTASTGEALLIAFKGRPKTRVLGEPTRGQTGATASLTLSDGATLTLTTAQMADRAGNTYPAPMPPDQPVATDWATLGTDSDPVIKAALAWLKAAHGCKG